MIDSYFLRSLFYTLLVYFILIGSLVVLTLLTGVAGALFVFIVVVLSLLVFYGGYKNIFTTTGMAKFE